MWSFVTCHTSHVTKNRVFHAPKDLTQVEITAASECEPHACAYTAARRMALRKSWGRGGVGQLVEKLRKYGDLFSLPTQPTPTRLGLTAKHEFPFKSCGTAPEIPFIQPARTPVNRKKVTTMPSSDSTTSRALSRETLIAAQLRGGRLQQVSQQHLEAPAHQGRDKKRGKIAD